MSVILPLICIVSQSFQSVFKKKLNERCAECEFSASMLISLFALIYFLISSKGFEFDTRLIMYSVAFSVCYATAAVTCVLALGSGSLALTDLILAYSTVIPLGYSLFFCNEVLNLIQIVGIIFLGVSFVFVYYLNGKNNEEKKIRFKWIVYVCLLFISNGMCGVIMRMQQNVFSGRLDNSFMIISLIMVVSILLVMAIIREGEKIFEVLKCGFIQCSLCGISNGIANYSGLLCLMVLPGAIYYPFVAAGGLSLTYIFSMIIFKEKFSKNQIVGFMFAILSMILINIK